MSSHKNDGSIAPKERVNIRYKPAVGDQTAEVELPLNLLITGNLRGTSDDTRWMNASHLLLTVTILTRCWSNPALSGTSLSPPYWATRQMPG
nr:type VI secretion protein, family [Salmonella sp. NCTC 7297]